MKLFFKSFQFSILNYALIILSFIMLFIAFSFNDYYDYTSFCALITGHTIYYLLTFYILTASCTVTIIYLTYKHNIKSIESYFIMILAIISVVMMTNTYHENLFVLHNELSFTTGLFFYLPLLICLIKYCLKQKTKTSIIFLIIDVLACLILCYLLYNEFNYNFKILPFILLEEIYIFFVSISYVVFLLLPKTKIN